MDRVTTVNVVLLLAGLTSACSDEGVVPETQSESSSQRLATRTSSEAITARKAEVEAWALEYHRQAGHLIVLTESLANGTVVDWVDASSDPGARAKAPPLPNQQETPEGVGVDARQSVAGPEGAVPYARPAFPPYIDGTSRFDNLEEYIKAIPAGNDNAENDRLYVLQRHVASNTGGWVAVNGHWANQDVPASPDFVINEMNAACTRTNGNVDLVGIVVGRHPALNTNYRLYVEFASNGNYHWLPYSGYHQVHATIMPGMELTGNESTPGGTQYESPLALQLDTVPNPNRWWFYWNGTGFGYVDVSEASLTTIANSACRTSYYGEANDGDQETEDWMDADMGSGVFPTGSTFSANHGTRGFFRRPQQYNGASVISVTDAPTAHDSKCYKGLLTTGGTPASSWNPTLFFGGPGGDSTTTTCE